MKKIFLLLFALQCFAFVKSQKYNYDITYQRMKWTVDPEFHFIQGIVTTYFVLDDSKNRQIVFDLSDGMIVDSIIYNGNLISFNHKFHKIYIELGLIPATTIDSLTIYYKGRPIKGGFGTFETSKHNGVPILWTLSEPFGARDWWPCKQTLFDKADSVDIFITAPKKYKAVSNGKLISEKINGNQKTTHWKHKYPIATYLVAIAVTNYDVYTDDIPINANCTVPMINYVYPENIEYAKYQTPALIPVFQLFCRKFIDYPFAKEKYGHAQFGWGGGMEHQTISFMVNFDDILMAHELSHQWFGDYITCGSWKDIWLNEGFAVFCVGLAAEYKLINQTYDSWKREVIYSATSKKNGSLYVDDTTSVWRIFDVTLTYNKGGAVLHMLRHQIGDSAFFTGVKNYLLDPKLAYGFAHTQDLQKHMETASGTDLSDFFRDWVFNQGYPVFNIVWNQNSDNLITIRVNQNPTNSSVSLFKLKLPFKFSGIGRDTIVNLGQTEQSQLFSFPLNFKVQHVNFDPEKTILTKGAQISRLILKEDCEILIAPNPVTNTLTVAFPIELYIKKVHFFSENGSKQTEYAINRSDTTFNFPVSNFKSGMYIIVIETAENELVARFMKN